MINHVRKIKDSEFMYDTNYFQLTENFLDEFKGKQPKWGPVGYITYKRTYARTLPQGGTEEFWQTLQRVVNGTFTIQKQHCIGLGLPWENRKAQRTAQKMYRAMWEFKFLPPGRGLWIMGTPFIEKHGSAALNNCAFTSTEDIDIKGTRSFEFMMDMSMLGVGVGFDTRGEDKIIIKNPSKENGVYEIPDTREGWVETLRMQLNAYLFGEKKYIFDYSKIRKAGEPIKGFGGVSAGAKPLNKLMNELEELLKPKDGKFLKSTDIVDIMNLIGKCVISGNVRRTAEIALGRIDDQPYLTMKQDKNKLESHRWASNNSVFALVGDDYDKIIDSVAVNGEPGIVWLEQARKFGRMKDKINWKDKQAKGVNPCLTGDSMIITDNGEIPIKELVDKYKDVKVLTYNIKTKEKEWEKITDAFKTKENADIIKVEFDDGTNLELTPDHKVYTEERGYIKASQLTKDDTLIGIE